MKRISKISTSIFTSAPTDAHWEEAVRPPPAAMRTQCINRTLTH